MAAVAPTAASAVAPPPPPAVAFVSDSPWADALAVSAEAAAAVPVASSKAGQPVRFLRLPAAHAFPRKSRSHVAAGGPAPYDTYVVSSGLLPAGWLHKHYERVPALVAAVYEFDAKQRASDWALVEAAIAASVRGLREDVGPRGVDVIVILVHDNITLVPAAATGTGGAMDDRAIFEVTQERLTSLRRTCGLDGQSLTLLFATDFVTHAPTAPGAGAGGSPASPLAPSALAPALGPLLASVVQGMRERVATYLKLRIEQLKSVLPRITAPPQAGLGARICFKIARYSELAGRGGSARKWDHKAATALLSLPRTPLNDREVRAFAELVMVRLVASYLRHPNEGVAIASGATMTSAQLAVITFQQHMRGYDQPACEPLLLGDHWAWVSRQYEAMGDLIHRAIDAPSLSKPTLAASPYWQSAALASIKRRRAAEAAGIRHGDGAAVTPTPLAMAARAELARWQILPPKHVGGWPGLRTAVPAGGSVGVEAAPPSPATSEDAGGPVAVAATAAVSDPLGATAAASGPVAGAAAVAAAAQARAIAGALAPSSVIAASDLTIAVGYASLIDADARWRAAEAVTALLERAQLASLLDAGALLPLDASAAPPSPALEPRAGVSALTHGRAWRLALVADELHAEGRMAEAISLLTAVTRHYEGTRSWSLLVRSLLRLRACLVQAGSDALDAAAAQLLVHTSLHLLAPAAHSNAIPPAAVARDLVLGLQRLAAAGAMATPIHWHLAPPPPLPAHAVAAALAQLQRDSPGEEGRASAGITLRLDELTLSATEVPLLVTAVAFDRRCTAADAGAVVGVTLLLASYAAVDASIDTVGVSFARGPVDSGDGAGSTPPDATASPFDVELIRAALDDAPSDGTLVGVSEGLWRLDRAIEPSPDRLRPYHVSMPAPLQLPARGVIAIQYEVRGPFALIDGPAAGDAGDAEQVPHAVDAIATALLDGTFQQRSKVGRLLTLVTTPTGSSFAAMATVPAAAATTLPGEPIDAGGDAGEARPAGGASVSVVPQRPSGKAVSLDGSISTSTLYTSTDPTGTAMASVNRPLPPDVDDTVSTVDVTLPVSRGGGAITTLLPLGARDAALVAVRCRQVRVGWRPVAPDGGDRDVPPAARVILLTSPAALTATASSAQPPVASSTAMAEPPPCVQHMVRVGSVQSRLQVSLHRDASKRAGWDAQHRHFSSLWLVPTEPPLSVSVAAVPAAAGPAAATQPSRLQSLPLRVWANDATGAAHPRLVTVSSHAIAGVAGSPLPLALTITNTTSGPIAGYLLSLDASAVAIVASGATDTGGATSQRAVELLVDADQAVCAAAADGEISCTTAAAALAGSSAVSSGPFVRIWSSGRGGSAEVSGRRVLGMSVPPLAAGEQWRTTVRVAVHQTGSAALLGGSAAGSVGIAEQPARAIRCVISTHLRLASLPGRGAARTLSTLLHLAVLGQPLRIAHSLLPSPRDSFLPIEPASLYASDATLGGNIGAQHAAVASSGFRELPLDATHMILQEAQRPHMRGAPPHHSDGGILCTVAAGATFSWTLALTATHAAGAAASAPAAASSPPLRIHALRHEAAHSSSASVAFHSADDAIMRQLQALRPTTAWHTLPGLPSTAVMALSASVGPAGATAEALPELAAGSTVSVTISGTTAERAHGVESLGILHVRWSIGSQPPHNTAIPMPSINIAAQPVTAIVRAPTHVRVGDLAPLTLRLRNCSSQVVPLFVELDHAASTSWLERQTQAPGGSAGSPATGTSPEADGATAGVSAAAAAAAAALRPLSAAAASPAAREAGAAATIRPAAPAPMELVVAPSAGASGGAAPRLVIVLPPAPALAATRDITWLFRMGSTGAHALPSLRISVLEMECAPALQASPASSSATASAATGRAVGTAHALAALASTLSHTPATIVASFALPLTHAAWQRDADALLRGVDILTAPGVAATASAGASCAGDEALLTTQLTSSASRRAHALRSPPLMQVDSASLGCLSAVAQTAT